MKAKVGGPDRDRTGDLLNAIQARSQLRYRPPEQDGTLHPSMRLSAPARFAEAALSTAGGTSPVQGPG